MFPTQSEVKAEIAHTRFNLFCNRRFKIIRNFVPVKKSPLTAVLPYKLRWAPLLLLLLGFSRGGVERPAHPFYVSVTEIAHNGKEKSLEITCKVFADDLEDVLRLQRKTAVDLTASTQKAQTDKWVGDYMARHLSLTVDAKKIPLSYVGFEKDAESAYVYFEAMNVSGVKKLEAVNSILQDFTDKQINIMHVIVGGQRKSYKLDYPQTTASFNF